MTQQTATGPMIPAIHTNGDTAQTLEAQNMAAYEAVRTAIAALQNAAPNGRNFYTQGADATQATIKEHVTRLNNLETVYQEIEQIIIGIQSQEV